MSQEILEQDPRVGETKPYPNYRVILLNDHENTIDHVELCLVKHIAGMSGDKAHQIALRAQNEGSATVWIWPKEIAEMYYEVLKSDRLTVTREPDG
jgi:ATP-dependent Clp protease adaptor protein ClpS